MTDRLLPVWCLVLWAFASAQGQPPDTPAASSTAAQQANNVPADDAAVDDDGDAVETPVERPRLTKDEISARIDALAQTTLPADQSKAVGDLLQQALSSASSIDELTARAQEWKTKTEQLLPLEKLQSDMQLPIEEVIRLQKFDPAVDRPPLEELETRAAKFTDTYIPKWRARLAEAETLLQRRPERTVEIPRLAAKAEADRTAALAELDKLAAEAKLSEVGIARRIWLEERVVELDATLNALAAETAYFTAAAERLPLMSQLAARKAAVYEKELEKVLSAINSRRKEDADRQAREAQNQAQSKLISRIAVLAEIAAANQQLTAERQQLLDANALANDELAEDRARRSELEAEFDKMQTRFNGRLSEASGQLLRDRKGRIPPPPVLRRKLAQRQAEQNEVQFRYYTASDRRAELTDIDTEVAKLLATIQPEDRAVAEPLLRNVLTKQRTYVADLERDYDTYSKLLANLVAEQEGLLQVATAYTNFIAERDLWIRSCAPLGMGSPEQQLTGPAQSPWVREIRLAMDAALWSFDPANWWQVLTDLRKGLQRRPLLATSTALVFLVLLVVQHRAREELRTLGDAAAKRSATQFLPSVRAVWLTLISSLVWPWLLWSLGTLLDSTAIETDFTRALAAGLRLVAWCLLFIEFLRLSYRSGGLADAHFAWPGPCLSQARRYLRLFAPVTLPLVLWIAGLDVQTTQHLWSSSLGRMLFLIVMIWLTFGLWRLLLVESSPIRQAIVHAPRGVVLSLHRLWRPMVVLLPLVFAGLAIAGYYYTAQQLMLRGFITAAMVAGLMLLGGLLYRWVLMSRRKLAREQARQRRAAALAAAEAQASSGGGEAPPVVAVDEEMADLSALSDQTRKLLQTVLQIVGLVAVVIIWQDMFPALTRLDENPLPLVSNSAADNPLTWGHLLRFVVAIAITYAAVRDLPSLLELVVLQKLSLDQGARYATSALVRYALLAIGVIAAAGSLGITGTSISWLVAAISVGLGFGLQEIFGNFVSGIILLFERPIRVGDIVTLGETTGVVSRIRIRATTIVDWDRKEYIVPNKDLVTQRLLNWTLTDPTNRVVITIGVAYGCDTALAAKILLDIATSHPEVMKDPAPSAQFEGFDDSSLRIVLRCFLPSLERRGQTIHDLHTAIDAAFRKHKIEIPYPQRDLNIRTAPPDVSILVGPSSDDEPGDSDDEGDEESHADGDTQY